jgi:two-component system, NarL family, response regulator DevR
MKNAQPRFMLPVARNAESRLTNGNGKLALTPRRELTIMVVDDHPAVRFGIVQLLEGQPDLHVEEICIDAESAVAHALARKVDVAVIDYQLPVRNGLWVCRKLKRAPDPPGVVIFSAFADDHLAACCAVAEADAVLNKAVLGSELCDTIRSVARGRRFVARVSPPFADMLRRRLGDREQVVFGMLLAAIPREEITHALGISERELQARADTILRTLEALPEVSGTGRRRRRLTLERVAQAPQREMRARGHLRQK